MVGGISNILHKFVEMLTRSILYNKLTSAVILLLMAALYALNVGLIGENLPVVAEGLKVAGELNDDVSRTLLGSALHSVEIAHPLLSQLLAAAMIVIGAVVVTMSTIKYNMHGVTTHLPSMIYIGLFAAFSRPEELLAPPLAALVMALSIKSLYDVYGYQELSHRLFNAIFLLGILPLIYPSMVLLFLAVMVAYTLFDRSGREVAVVVVAYFTPLALQLYVVWLLGEGIGAQLAQFWEVFVCFRGGVVPLIAQLSLLALLIPLGVYVVRNIDDLSITLMSRKRTLYAVVLYILSLSIVLVPSFSLPQMLIVAPSVSIFFVTAIALLHDRWAHYIYLLLFVLFVAVEFIPTLV